MTQEKESVKDRVTKFRDGMIELSERLKINIRPQMTADGMVLSLFDAETNSPVIQDQIK